MQINVHNFTLTTAATATITVQADSGVINELPRTVLNKLAEAEALNLTGFEWQAVAYSYEETTAPAGDPIYAYTFKMNKF